LQIAWNEITRTIAVGVAMIMRMLVRVDVLPAGWSVVLARDRALTLRLDWLLALTFGRVRHGVSVL
jgi:hypothetical protein